MKNIKGFTMIELLTTIIILGLLTTLAYFGVSAILNRGSNSYYNSQENMIVLAGKEYFADYREKLPKDIGKTSSVTLDTLIKESYIDPVKDEDDNDCNRDKTTVTVQKITDKDYQYYVTLVCDYYETKEDTAKPVITFSPNKQSTTKTITVKMEVTDNKDVASYRYVITKDGEEYRDSGYENYTGPITIKLTEKGLYEIVGYAYDSSGNRGSKRSGKYSIYKGINCAEVEFDSNVNVRKWTNKDITVTMKLPDNTYRWELSKRVDGGEYETVNSYIGAANRKISFDSEGKHQLKLVVYDDDGNSCIATTGEYYIDKTKPTCTSSGGSSSWTNDDITLKGTCSDKGGSGCAGNVSKTFNSETNTNKASPGTVKDKAGNSVSCPANQIVKIDKTPPEVSYSYLSGAFKEEIYYTSNYTYTFYYKDTLSGINRLQAAAKLQNGSKVLCSSEWHNFGGSVCSDYANDNANHFWRGYRIYDNAGNYTIICSYTKSPGSVSTALGAKTCTINGFTFK